MTLSLEKLKKLLKYNNLVPRNYYTIHGICVMIEVLNIQNGEKYIMYIPSNYEFYISDSSYEIKTIDIENISDLSNDFVDNPSSQNIEENYKNIMTSIDRYDNIEESLNNNYRTEFNIKDSELSQKHDVLSIYRQLFRLKFCVQNIKYKLSIIYKNYLCIIHIDNTIECFKIKHYKKEDNKKLYILIDLELFFENIDIFSNDLEIIRSNINYILDKNHKTHSSYITRLLSQQTDMSVTLSNILNIKKDIKDDVNELKSKLNDLITSETDILDKFEVEFQKYKRKSSVHTNLKFTQYKLDTEQQLNNIDSKKYETTENIVKLITKENNISLLVDKLMFENTIMLNKVFDNIKKLEEISCD